MSEKADRPWIEITLNGLKKKVVEQTTLAELLDYFVTNEISLAVARNGTVVHQGHYCLTKLEEGDKIQFINPDFGG